MPEFANRTKFINKNRLSTEIGQYSAAHLNSYSNSHIPHLPQNQKKSVNA